MSDLLGIGASGVATYGAALGVVGENVANAQTPGYARRDVAIQTLVPANNNALYPGRLAAGGVQATGVTRAWDQFRAADALNATAEDGRAAATATWTDAANDALGQGDGSTATKVGAVFTAATALAADPANATARTQMVNAVAQAATSFSTAAGRLATVSDGIGQAAQAGVAGVNDDLAGLARLNVLLAGAPANSEAKAGLADSRDQLLADLSGKLGITTKFAGDGTVAVGLAGAGNTALVAGNAAALLSVAQGSDGRLSFATGAATASQPIQPTGGALAGLAAAANTTAGLRNGLDAAATGFATRLNAWNAAGKTATGTAGGDLLAATGGAAGIALLPAATGDAIAAAGADGTANGNLLALADLRGSDGAEAQLATLANGGTQALASAQAQAAAAATRKSAALTAQGDVSGVSLDQEAAQLIRYQQAFQGSAKVIQAAQTTMNAILSLFGG